MTGKKVVLEIILDRGSDLSESEVVGRIKP